MDLRDIHELLEQKSSKTTETYTYTSNKDIGKIKRLLDTILLINRVTILLDVMENEKINGKILEVWEDYQNERGEYLPILYPTIKRDGILFVGLNPSFNKTFFEKKLGKEYNFDKT